MSLLPELLVVGRPFPDAVFRDAVLHGESIAAELVEVAVREEAERNDILVGATSPSGERVRVVAFPLDSGDSTR